MKPKLTTLSISLLTLLLTYLIFSFVRWDLNVSNSSTDVRLGMVFLWILSMLLSFLLLSFTDNK
jgi:hypothetical protein